MVSGLQLWVAVQVLGGLYYPGRHPGFLQYGHHLFSGMAYRPLLYQIVQFLFIPLSFQESRKLPLLCPERIAHNPAHTLPLLVGEDGDSAPSIFSPAAVGTMGSGSGITVPVSFQDSPVCVVV